MGKRITALVMLPLILALQAGGALALLSVTRTLERTVQHYFQEYFLAELRVEGVYPGLFSGIRCDGVSITPLDKKKPVFQARSLVLGYRPGELLKGRLVPSTLTLVDPLLVLDQGEDGLFSLEKLIRSDRSETFSRDESALREEGISTVIVSRGMIRLEGDGPLPSEVRRYLAPDRELELLVPTLFWADPGKNIPQQPMGGMLFHPVLGEIPVQGLVDGEGIRSLCLGEAKLDPTSKVFRAAVSDELRSILDQTGFKGTLTWRFKGERDAAGTLRPSLEFSGFEVQPDHFPVRFHDIQGRLVLEESMLRVEKLTTQALDGRIRASAQFYMDQDWVFDFTAAGEELTFCREIENALQRVGVREDYRAFAPEGRGDILFNGQVTRAQPWLMGDLLIRPRNASASYEGYIDPITGVEDSFPYRLHDLMGEVMIRFSDCVEIRSLEGRTGPSTRNGSDAVIGWIKLDGRVGVSDDDSSLNLQVEGRDLIMDEKLRQGLLHDDPETVALLDDLHAAGRFDLDAIFQRTHQGERSDRIVVDLLDVSLSYEKFPYLLEHIRGRVIRDSDLIRVQNLVGYCADPGDPVFDVPGPESAFPLSGEEHSLFGPGTEIATRAEVSINAKIRDESLEELILHGKDQQISSQLKSALHGVLPEQLALLNDIKFRGTTDYSLVLQGGDAVTIMDLDLDLHMDRISGGSMPLLVEDARGSLHLDLLTGDFEARDIQFRTGSGDLSFHWIKGENRDDLFAVDVRGVGQDLGLDTDLSGLLSAEVLQTLQTLDCRGRFDLENLDLQADIDRQGRVVRFASEMDLRVNNGSLAFPAEISHLFGGVTLNMESGPGEEDRFQLRGGTHRISFELNERLFTDMETDFKVDAQSLLFSYLRGSFYGGRLQGMGDTPLQLDLISPRSFAGELRVDDADIRYLFNRGSYAARNISGRISGRLKIDGEMDNPHLIKAKGEVEVKDASLFELPLFGDLSRLMGTVFNTNPPTFTGAKTDYEYEGASFALTDINLSSTLMELHGQGLVTFDGLDLKFIPSTSIMPHIPIIGHIVNFIKDGLLTFSMSGPWTNLEVSYETLVGRIFTDDRVPDEFRYMGKIDYTFPDRF